MLGIPLGFCRCFTAANCGGVAIGSAIGLRDDFSASDLRALARGSGDAAQVRRLLALAVICAGVTRQDAAIADSVGLQTVRDRCCGSTRRAQRDCRSDLSQGKAPGKVALQNPAQLDISAVIVEAGTGLALHVVVRWRIGGVR